MDDITTTLTRILTGTFGVPDAEVTPQATFESLGLDSLDVVELTLVVEEELGVKIEDEELEDVRTVGDAADRIAAKLGVSA
jgi:acyl carrier protein